MKRVLLSLTLVFIIFCAQAQSFNAGLKIGYNSSFTLSNPNYTVDTFKSEFWENMKFGCFARLNFSKLYLQPELMYVMQRKDYQFSFTSPNAPTVGDFAKIRAIDFPLLVGYKLIDLKVASIRCFAGPNFRFNAGSRFGNLAETEKSFKDAAIGFDIGASADVLMLTFDIRYSYAGNLVESSWDDVKNALSRFSNSGLTITLGWKLL